MTDTLPFIRDSAKGVLLEVYVQPKASRNEIVGVHEGRLKLKLTAPPVEGEANRECVKFLAEVLKTPKTHVEVVQGHKSRRKTILVADLSIQAVQKALRSAL